MGAGNYGKGYKNASSNDKKGNSYKNNYGKNNNSKNNHGNKKSGSPWSGQAQSYVGAPYNFVPFSNQVHEYKEGKQTAHNQMSEDLITGELTYEVEAQTPVIVDNGKGKFSKDARGRYAIPGSTMRGLIRNNVQILGLAGYEDDIDDYALMYRNVANGAEKDRYNKVLGSKQIRINDGEKNYNVGVLLNVRAGYVENKGGAYTIYQTCVDSIRKEFKEMNYYVLSERKIIGDYLAQNHKFAYDAFRPGGKSILQHEFAPFQRKEARGRVQYIGTKNDTYKPYCIKVSYNVANQKDIIAVGKPGQYGNEGYAVSTGKMNQKKVVYIIPQIDRDKPTIKIPQKDVRAFQIDMKKKENTLRQFGGRECFDLPKEGDIKPIFYIELDGRLYFGFTPRLRLFYDHTLKEGLKQERKAGSVDYSQALFGYAGPDGSYKSKVSFSDAVVQGSAEELSEQRLILAEPKPSSYLDYLKPGQGCRGGKTGVTYNTDGFELRGAKQYWLHKQAPPKTMEMNNNNQKVASSIRPLAKGTKFQGKVRFQNLTQDELGLLLWAIRLNEGSWMNVGKAKAFGYGAISVKITEAKKLDLARAYAAPQTLDLDPFCEISVDGAIDAYKAQINQSLGGRDIDSLPHIKDFFQMKDSRHLPDEAQIRYMSIANREYQSRKEALPSVGTVVGSE